MFDLGPRPLSCLSTLGLSLSLLALATHSQAWDEVTHARIADIAIDLVQEPELARVLQQNRELVRFGAWFPDWAQYAGRHPFDRGSHREVVAAYMAYVGRDDVRQQANYPRLLAHAFGAYGHSVMDFYYDSTLYAYLRERDNGLSRDAENGMMYLRQHGYLGLRVDASLPLDDLREVYSSLGYFRRDGLDPEDFAEQINRHTRAQFLNMRGLKLLSFLGSDHIQAQMPWAAANALEAPGGIRDNALAVARVWEALWREMHGLPTGLFVHSLPRDGGVLPGFDPRSHYGRVTLLAARSLDIAKLRGAVSVADSRGQPVPGKVDQLAYGSELHADFVIQFIPDQPLQPGGSYLLTVEPGEYGAHAPARARGYEMSFAVAESIDTSAPARASGYRLGLFLFVLLGGLGGVLFGLPTVAVGTIRWRSAARGTPRTLPSWTLWVGRVVELAGVAVFLAGVILLYLKGVPFIEMVL